MIASLADGAESYSTHASTVTVLGLSALSKSTRTQSSSPSRFSEVPAPVDFTIGEVEFKVRAPAALP